MWDPAQYQRFADERSRPFYDLTARIGAIAPGHVVDLGCGPGRLTASLAARWPLAEVVGIDSSAQMVAAAEQADYGEAARGGRLSFALGDINDWQPAGLVDVIVSNAVLQWVPDHMRLLSRWVSWLAPAGWIAFQLPGNFDQPTHVVLGELASSARWRDRLAGVLLNRQAGELGEYLDLLAGLDLSVDAWETTYLHVLHGPDPVTEWYKGTGLRPVLAALDAAEARAFVAEYSRRVRRYYPVAPYGTVLPFRRVFVVAQKA